MALEPLGADRPIQRADVVAPLGEQRLQFAPPFAGMTATTGARAAPASNKAEFAFAFLGSGTPSTTSSEDSRAWRRVLSQVSPGLVPLSSDQRFAPKA